MPQFPTVMVHVTQPDGTVLDSFPVSHWRAPDSETDDFENVGSSLSESLLIQRIRRFVEEVA